MNFDMLGQCRRNDNAAAKNPLDNGVTNDIIIAGVICMKEARNVTFGNLDTKDPSEMELLEKS